MSEQQKVCAFYWKIGACRHGNRCSHLHNKPVYSQTIMIRHMYPNPIGSNYVDQDGNVLPFTEEFIKEFFENFYADVFIELDHKQGLKIEELNVCDNTCEHLFGNVYIKFENEEDAQKALTLLKGRFYAGRMLVPEYSPVLNFAEARCKCYEKAFDNYQQRNRDNKENMVNGDLYCPKGPNCNYLHLRKPSEECLRYLYGDTRYESYKAKMENLVALGGPTTMVGGGGSSSSSNRYEDSSSNTSSYGRDNRFNKGNVSSSSGKDKGGRYSKDRYFSYNNAGGEDNNDRPQHYSRSSSSGGDRSSSYSSRGSSSGGGGGRDNSYYNESSNDRYYSSSSSSQYRDSGGSRYSDNNRDNYYNRDSRDNDYNKRKRRESESGDRYYKRTKD
ncbi:hypothetical protein ABK040_012793 [Willaertia magna]